MKRELKYGLLLGAGYCLWSLADFALGFHTKRFDLGEQADSYSTFLPFAVLSVMLLRRQLKGETVTFGQGARSGAEASLVGGLVLYLFMFVYNRFINPGWVDAALDWKVAGWRARGVTEFDIRDHIDFYHKVNSPLGCFLSLVLGTTVLGTLYSLLFTLFLRRKPRA